MSLTNDDKVWIDELLTKKLSDLGSQLVRHMPRGFVQTAFIAALGFAAAAVIMDIKNKDIKHISYPLAELERMLVEGAGEFAVLTGGFLADYNRMHPSINMTQLIIGLSNAQAKAFMAAMFQRESSSNYSIVHKYGYLGGYGFGAIALADIGYISLDKLNAAPSEVRNGSSRAVHLAFLQNNDNWARYSYEEFMSNPAVQDRAFIALANLSIQRGFKKGALKRGDHKRLAGFAAAAHLVGFPGAFRYYTTMKDSDDRNGTTASEYAKLGEKSIKGAAPKDVGVIPSGLPMDARFYSRVSSGFGQRIINGKRGMHSGIDFPVATGTPVKATADAKVIFAGNYAGSCGYGVKLQHGSDYTTVFCHLSRIDVRAGQWLRKGVIVGQSGGAKGAIGAGRSTGPHIHYSVKYKNMPVNPSRFIKQISGDKAFAIRPQQLPLITRGSK